ncbi:MAG: protein O-mannosyl-transferase family [Sedimentisphaerales bacterium]
MTNTKPKLGWWYFAVLCSTGVLYAVSCAPGALWQDSGLIQYRIWHNDIEGFLGLAISHPLFYILAIGAKYVPLGEFTCRVNLVSAIAGAVAVANLFLLIRLWLGKNFPAIITAVTFALSHTFWRHASIIETYTLWTAIFTAELIMLLQYVKTNRVGFLYWLGLLNGLAIAVHMLASIPLLCYAVFFVVLLIKKDIHLKNLAIIVLLWIVGALPYEYLIIKNIIQTGGIGGTLASALFGMRWQAAVLNTSLSARILKENFLFILYNFPTPNILLFFVGCWGFLKISPRPHIRYVLLGLMVLFFIFAFRYTVPDRYAFFIPFYCVASIFVGLGAHLLLLQINHKVFMYLVSIFSLLPVGVYAAAPTFAEKMQLNLGTRSNLPYRNDYKYFLQPWKTGYKGAERFANEALDAVESNAIIFADSTTVAPLLLMQEIKGKRPDVKIVSGIVSSKNAPTFNEHTIEQLLEDKPVYVVSPKPGYCPAFVLDNYDLVRAGVLWRVVKFSRHRHGDD